MSEGFKPGVEAAKLGAAVHIETKPHPPGGAGVKLSLDEVALRVAKGRNDPRVRSWAIRAIHEAGVGGMNREMDQAEAIRAALKKATVYVGDPLNTEFMQAAAETLCLDDKGFCFRGGDCFPKGTLVRHKTRGEIPIERLEPGDVVYGWNDWTRVEAIADKGVLSVSKIVVMTGMSKKASIFLTEDHHVFVMNHLSPDGHTRIRVKDLLRNDHTLLAPRILPDPTPSIDFRTAEHGRVVDVEHKHHEVHCYDIQTTDHYVYLPEYDVTVSQCDDLTIAYASATLSVGIPTNVVGQAFKNTGVPSHVIAAVMNPKTKEWYRVDPSTDKKVGDYVPANQEWWIDPLDVNDKTSSTVAGAGDFVGVGKLITEDEVRRWEANQAVRQGYTGVGQAGTPAAPGVAMTVIQQVQAALYDLQTTVSGLASSLTQIDQIKAQLGYDPEPSTPITGIPDFPTDGTWTLSMDTVSKSMLSQGQFLVRVCQDALNGARDIYVDTTSNDIGFESASSDPYSWKTIVGVVGSSIVGSILGIFSPAGALLVGITEAAGEVLSPAQVQAQAGTTTGTVQGPPRGTGAVPVVAIVAIAAVTIVATIATCVVYVKLLGILKTAVDFAVFKGYVAVAEKLFPGDPTAQATFIAGQRAADAAAAAASAKDNPFGGAVDSFANLVKWGAIGAAVIGGGVLLLPFLKEASESAAASLHARRLARASQSPPPVSPGRTARAR